MAVIQVDNLVKRYRGRPVLNGVSFTVDEGEIFGILGPNGAGKTTTVECIEGLRARDAGTIRVLGFDPARRDGELQQLLGAQLQESELPARITVEEALDLYSSFYRRPADRRELTELLGLADKLSTQYRRLSGGQKQRLSIALALIGSPRVAVLDELTTGLDPQARRDVWELIERIRNRGVTILLVTHFMDEAERLCDRLAVIDSGRVAALDTPGGLIAAVESRQTVRFRPTSTLDDGALRSLPEVTTVERSGSQVVVTGTGELLFAITAELARRGVGAAEMRSESATLDDAYVALTGRSFDA